MRYSKTARYVVQDKKTGLYIAERSGSWARWEADRDLALRELKSWWDEVLNPEARKLFRFEKA